MRKLLFLSVLLLACESSTAPEPDGLAGEYHLQAVQGDPLPFFYEGDRFLSGGVLTLRADGTYQDLIHHGEPGLDDTRLSVGTWSEDDGAVVLEGTGRTSMDRVTLGGVEIDGLEYRR